MAFGSSRRDRRKQEVNDLVHKDSLQNETGWDTEEANVIFDNGFAVKVQDPSNLSIRDWISG